MPDLPIPARDPGASLTAIVVYRRPALRRRLLGQIADLGIFVVEHPGTGACGGLATMARADVAVVVAGEGRDTDVVADLRAAGIQPVVVAVPEGVDCQAFLDAGALRCVPEREFGASTQRLLAEAASVARRRRGGVEGAGIRVGAALFNPAVPSISAAGRTRVLSRSESAVLRRLDEANGYPVDIRELERAAAPEGRSVRPGFLKATILRLRRKLADVGLDPETVRTVRGFGYALCVDRESP